MKVVLTGGGTGGHFYPLIAVAEEIHRLTKERKLLDVKLFYLAPTPYDSGALFDNQIAFLPVPSGKQRTYSSFKNFTDKFKVAYGCIKALWFLFKIYPDLVFSKGGFVSVPVVWAAKILRIPVMIHESDSVPGRANIWAAKYAKRIATSYEEAVQFFPTDKTACTGQPIRRDLFIPQKTGAREFLKLHDETPVLLVLGGSSGSQIINETLIDALPSLVTKYSIIHQTGTANLVEVKRLAEFVLKDSPYKDRYRAFDFLSTVATRMAIGVAQVVVSRAGSTVFEIANWGLPSIIIPITDSNGDHQRKNAYTYARSGAAIVIEEANLSAAILESEVDRVFKHPEMYKNMATAAKVFARPDAGEKIAEQILKIGLTHEA